jgi:enamine deaminase RidA (YjgF/YER057c/UK114 family)
MTTTAGRVEHLNPEGLAQNPAFTNVVTVTGPMKTVYVGGQNGVDAAGTIVGKGDVRTQTEQVFRNLATALAAAGAELDHVIKWTIYVIEGCPIQPAFEVFQQIWGRRPNPPLIALAMVSGSAHPEALVELDAVAVVPLDATA